MKNIIGLLILVFLGLGCQSDGGSKDPEKPSINAQMSEVATRVRNLVPYVYSPSKFADEKNRETIESELRQMQGVVHGLSEKKLEMMLGKDPLIHHIVNNIERDIKGAVQSFKYRNFKFARTSVKNAIHQCFQCHTRTNVGVQYSDWGLDFDNLDIPATERADLLVSTRQFEKSIKVLENIFIKPTPLVNQRPFEKEEAIKKILITYVRVLKDPVKAYQKLEYLKGLKTTPNYIAESMGHWERSIKKWLAEQSAGKDKKISIQDQLDRAHKVAKDSGYDAAFVDYLRVSANIHAELGAQPDHGERAKLYYQMGQVYDVLKDAGFWDIPLVYFEACIHELPNSAIAKKCYKEVEQEITLGFTGSAGTFIPDSERAQLEKLKKEAGFK